MPFEIVRNDIVKMDVDAIVNTANPKPVIGSGVDSGIHTAAGAELLRARQLVGDIPVGSAAITPGFALPSKFVIHTAGPVWRGGEHGEAELLASCYRKSLALALENGCESAAFPLISTGNYGFPKALALQIAVREFSDFLMAHEMQIYLVVFGREAFSLSERLFSSVKSFIDENYIRAKTRAEYGGASLRHSRFEREMSVYADEEASLPLKCEICAPSAPTDDLDAVLSGLDAGFSETLLHLIEKAGKKDSDIYKKANIDRKLFSKIRSNPDYKPSKSTALAFAIALEMDIDGTRDLISRAGYALSRSSKFDVIIEYFITQKNYDIFEINEALFAFDQSLLGA